MGFRVEGIYGKVEGLGSELWRFGVWRGFVDFGALGWALSLVPSGFGAFGMEYSPQLRHLGPQSDLKPQGLKL